MRWFPVGNPSPCLVYQCVTPIQRGLRSISLQTLIHSWIWSSVKLPPLQLQTRSLLGMRVHVAFLSKNCLARLQERGWSFEPHWNHMKKIISCVVHTLWLIWFQYTTSMLEACGFLFLNLHEVNLFQKMILRFSSKPNHFSRRRKKDQRSQNRTMGLFRHPAIHLSALARRNTYLKIYFQFVPISNFPHALPFIV